MPCEIVRQFYLAHPFTLTWVHASRYQWGYVIRPHRQLWRVRSPFKKNLASSLKTMLSNTFGSAEKLFYAELISPIEIIFIKVLHPMSFEGFEIWKLSISESLVNVLFSCCCSRVEQWGFSIILARFFIICCKFRAHLFSPIRLVSSNSLMFFWHRTFGVKIMNVALNNSQTSLYDFTLSPMCVSTPHH